VLVVLALAALAVVAAVVFLAAGQGGELSEAHPDLPPTMLPGHRPLQGTDAVLMRLPRGLFGYNVAITDDALSRLAYALTERDTRVAMLEQQLAEQRLQRGEGDAGPGQDPPWYASPSVTSSGAWSTPQPLDKWAKQDDQGE
jgi:hypothetical protein